LWRIPKRARDAINELIRRGTFAARANRKDQPMKPLLLMFALLALASVTWGQEFQPSARNLIIANSTMAAFAFGDALQTVHSGGVETGTPWLYGSLPYRNPTRVYMATGAEVGLFSLASTLMLRNRHTRRFWWTPQASEVITHSVGLTVSYRRGAWRF
jgi:hypothetical protein